MLMCSFIKPLSVILAVGCCGSSEVMVALCLILPLLLLVLTFKVTLPS
jgi:hypothetical protein